MRVIVHDPPQEVREVVHKVLERSLREQANGRADEYERKVFQTPGVIEALDEALDEIEALKRSL